jgi:hypothetical protein
MRARYRARIDLMPVKVVEWTPLALPVSEKPYAGWVERVAYQMMDHVLKTGWTPERSAPFYGAFLKSKCVVWSRMLDPLSFAAGLIDRFRATPKPACQWRRSRRIR